MNVISVINLIVIAIFAMSVARFYNRHTEYFFAMLIIVVYWTQLLVSSAYIETGVYLKDIGKTSYATGVTIRLFLMIEFMLCLISYWAGKHPKIVIENPKEGRYTYNTFKRVECVLFLLYAYRLLDVIVSGNVLTNSNVNRFNYFSEFSKLPFAQIIDYFSYPCLWMLGYILLLGEKKRQKAFPIAIFLMNLLSVFLCGVEFGGFLQCTLYFLGPLLLSMAKRRKLIKLRYVAVAAILLVVMLIPKYNHFSEAIENGHADTSYGLTTAYDFLMYRMLAQEADLTWEIDRQVWIDGDIDPERAFDVAKEVIGIPTAVNSTQYLMNRGCSSSALTIYSYSTATVTGGYPILWVAIFGYFFAIPFLIVDSYLLFLVIRCICEGMEKQRLFLILAGGYLVCQCYTIVISANFSAIGNTIPHIFIVLLLILYKRIGMLRIGNHTFWI